MHLTEDEESALMMVSSRSGVQWYDTYGSAKYGVIGLREKGLVHWWVRSGLWGIVIAGDRIPAGWYTGFTCRDIPVLLALTKRGKRMAKSVMRRLSNKGGKSGPAYQDRILFYCDTRIPGGDSRRW